MRFPEPHEDLVGTVCACSIGRAGIVTGKMDIDLEVSVEAAAEENEQRAADGLPQWPFTWVQAGDVDPKTGEVATTARGYLTKEMWVGLGFDGKGTWASAAPVVLAENGDEYRQKLQDRFGGKLTYNA